MPQKESREPVRPLPAGGAGSHRRRPKPRAPPRLLQSRKVHRRRRHSRRPLQPRLLRPHLRRKRPSQTPQLRRRTAPLTQSPLLNPRLRLQRKSRKSRQGQPILPRRNLPHPQRLRRRRKHRQRRKSQTLAPPRSSRLPHPRPRHRQPLSASSRPRKKLMVFRNSVTAVSSAASRATRHRCRPIARELWRSSTNEMIYIGEPGFA
jgi:hypothetical protein